MYHTRRFAFPRWMAFVVPLVCAAVLGAPGFAWGQNIVKVQEDWELVIGGPDTNSVSPQITTTMSPFGHLNDTYFTFEINHKSVPSFLTGGLHVHQWTGESRQSGFSRTDTSLMSTSNEVVTWTQIMSVGNGRLKFQVRDGVSTTWGNFGYSGLMIVEKGWVANHINGYTPDLSVAQSGVGYAGNRVESLKLKRVVLTLSDGHTVEDNTVRIVHQLVD